MYQSQEYLLPQNFVSKSVTRYFSESVKTKAYLIYLHGGGLLYGSRNDLPSRHLELLTNAGYQVICLDYPLAPDYQIEEIVNHVCSSITWCVSNIVNYGHAPLPYVLWGRSAGAYLCLIAASHGNLSPSPSAILSYYGYGFLCNDWFCTPNHHYKQFPTVSESCLSRNSGNFDIQSHFERYVYARQSGTWKNIIYTGRDKDFYLRYSLRSCTELPCALFAAHATGDPDVPFAEFQALCERYHPYRFIESSTIHDFDRLDTYPFESTLGAKTIEFLDNIIKLR